MSVRRKSADVAPVAPAVPRQRRGSDLSDKVAMFNKKFQDHHEKQLSNPFSDVERPDGYQATKLDVNDPNYGRPPAGSMTELRGKKANQHMRKEWRTLCETIYDCGYRFPDGTAIIRFGDLFNIYNTISDKCVGNLLSARKHGFVSFEGEMLYQRRDEDTEITLAKPIEEIVKLLPIVFDPNQHLLDNLQE
ncbi:actin-binding Rho-activating protein-like [Daphnia carinata]|uniref:actin-binding Rho-activating protein-like n=1 Tax=Daphnia carinata TaxID=120202 RepID=UPI00257F1D96|nr:actin-binding Rho-activating protein-like [Daphnia carinata]